MIAADEVMEDASSDSPRIDASPSDSQQQQHQQPPLLTAFDKDAVVKGLRPGLRDRLCPAVSSLQEAIQSEMVAHILTLFRYVRLQQQLMAVKEWGRNRAAQQLNKWIASAYEGEQGSAHVELLVRIKHDAHRLFDLFSEPEDDDEWWPSELEAIAAEGGRAKHLLEALLLLNRYHESIQKSFEREADRLQLLEYYLRTVKWSAHQIEQDLINDGVIKPRKKKSQSEAVAPASALAAPSVSPSPSVSVSASAVSESDADMPFPGEAQEKGREIGINDDEEEEDGTNALHKDKSQSVRRASVSSKCLSFACVFYLCAACIACFLVILGSPDMRKWLEFKVVLKEM